jgi:hypothetical protein
VEITPGEAIDVPFVKELRDYQLKIIDVYLKHVSIDQRFLYNPSGFSLSKKALAIYKSLSTIASMVIGTSCHFVLVCSVIQSLQALVPPFLCFNAFYPLFFAKILCVGLDNSRVQAFIKISQRWLQVHS